MKYVQVKNGVVVRRIHDTEPTRWDEDNYCFARKLSPERATALGVFKLKIITPPYFDAATQKRFEGSPACVDGVWTQVYVVEDMTLDEAAERRGEWAARARALRDHLLAGTDWMAAGDRVIAPAWRAYRQALRDISAQPGFPYTINWPVRPE